MVGAQGQPLGVVVFRSVVWQPLGGSISLGGMFFRSKSKYEYIVCRLSKC